jgi:hypothetical protein
MELARLLLLGWSALMFWVLGQIWMVQVIIYPLFARVGEADYLAYHRFYSRRIPVPVIAPGFLSFLLPVGVALFGPAVPFWMTAANIASGMVSLLVTVLLQIPRHARLEKYGKDKATINELIRYNWPRTWSISAQALVTLAMLHHVFELA